MTAATEILAALQNQGVTMLDRDGQLFARHLEPLTEVQDALIRGNKAALLAQIREDHARVVLLETSKRLTEMMQERTSTHSRIARQLATWAKEGRDIREELEAFAMALEAFDSQITLCRVDAVDRLQSSTEIKESALLHYHG